MWNNTFTGDTAGSLKRPLKGLSCLLGNWHGQFLEGLGLVTAPGYSAIIRQCCEDELTRFYQGQMKV